MAGESQNQEHVFVIALRAIAIAQSNFHLEVTLEHVLMALLERPEVEKCFSFLKIDINAIQQQLTAQLKTFANSMLCTQPVKSKEFHEIFSRTIAFSKFNSRQTPDGVDCLFQFVQLPSIYTSVSILLQAELDTKKIKSYINQDGKHPHQEFTSENEPKTKTDALNYIRKFCSNLNELANEGKIDPVIGRLSELKRITQVVARRTKNNVVLVGYSGIGKTSIIEGLACNITQGNVPTIIKDAIIWSLDIGALVAGTRFRGDFEERMKFIIKSFALLEDENHILFIDEIHMIMDAGNSNKGTLDVGNLLKPALARGKLRCIGSTTDKDWRQYFEKDRALLRRFNKIIVEEPSVEDTKLILYGLRDRYEIFHQVRYTNEALEAAVTLTSKYIHDGKLPDKAIDIIDEAGAKQKIDDLERKEVIDIDDIESEVSRITKIPLNHLKNTETNKLEFLERDLKTVVFGQDNAVRLLTDAVLISQAGLRESTKPEGSFLFTGPSGSGKTELARQLAKALGLPLIKFDMSEYMEKHASAKFIGSPPGYVGFGDGAAGSGLLINSIDMTPSCVLLLDEIEKAHSDIFNLLLQVMEDAILTNSEGKSTNFRNVILIMTSNVGVARTEQHGMGFIPSEISIDDTEVKRLFSPEFRNRLDAIVTFNALDRGSITKIVNKFLNQLQELVREKKISIEVTEAAKKYLSQKGHDAILGARPMARLIAEKIKQPLSKMMLFGSLKNGGTAKVSVEHGELVVRDFPLETTNVQENSIEANIS